MPLTDDRNEALRLLGLSGWRSGSRDHPVPMVHGSRKLLRVRVNEALPTVGVEVASVAASAEVRAAAAAAVAKLGGGPTHRVVPAADRVTRHYSLNTTNDTVLLGAYGDSVKEAFTAPSDGYLIEIIWLQVNSAPPWRLALRTDGGETIFPRGADGVTIPALPLEPDFIQPEQFHPTAGWTSPVTKCRVPMKAGERLLAVMRVPTPALPGLVMLQMVFGFEFTDVTASKLVQLADELQALKAQRLQRVQSLAEQTGKLVAPKPAPLPRVEVPRELVGYGFQRGAVVLSPAPPPPPAAPRPRSVPARPVPLEGADQTFVSAWNPSFGSIGYLIPNPPRGGHVNVFDNMYTIWDISGRNVGQGPIIPVHSESDIPPGARISPVISGTKSPAMETPAGWQV